MDTFSARILRELLPIEKEIPAPVSPKDAPPDLVDHWTTAVLKERAAYLGKLAKYGDGSASETLKDYPQHCAMLFYRSRNGDVELNENLAVILFVIDGTATLVTGAPNAPVENRSGPLLTGKRRQLRAGDVAHVPAGQPYQMLVSSERPIACLMLKVQESS